MRLLIVLCIFMFLQIEANAFNALEENRRNKQLLEVQASQQYVENYQHTKYYKGKPDYLYSSNSKYSSTNSSGKNISSKKALYVKKGVKFKLSDEDKIKILKEKQQKELENELKKQALKSSNTNLTDSKETQNKDIEQKDRKIKYSLKATDKTPEKETVIESSVNTQQQETNTHNADAE